MPTFPSIEIVLQRELDDVNAAIVKLGDRREKLLAAKQTLANGTSRPAVRKRAKRRGKSLSAKLAPRIPAAKVAAKRASIVPPRTHHGERTGLTSAILDYVRTRGAEGATVQAIANAVGRKAESISSTMTRLTKRNALRRNEGIYTFPGDTR